MGVYSESSIKKGLPNLCKKCGRCCRVVTNNDYTYSELQRMASEGNEYAKDFLKIFEPYPSIEAARKIDAKVVDNIVKVLQLKNKYDESSLTFYRCKYLLSNNTCSIYEERPELCIQFPSNGWAVVPPGCGFESWLFCRREETMQKIRHAKEELLDLRVIKSKTNDESIIQKIETVERRIYTTIEMYSKYDAQNW